VPRYVVLLRGINVGGNKKIAMADLRELLSRLEYADVRTHLQSGNAVLSSPSGPAETASRIETGLLEELGISVRCLVRTGDELRAVIDGNPLAGVATNGSRYLAVFISEQPDPGLLAGHDPAGLAPGEIHLGERVIYQWCPEGIMAAPPLAAYVEKHLGVVATARNWNTVTRLQALLGE